MKKSQVITLVVLLVVLGLCVAGYFVGKKYFADKEKAEEAAKTTTVFKLDTSKVSRVAYSYDGKPYVIVKEGMIWKNSADKAMKLKQTDVGDMISTLRKVKADTVIKNPKDIKEYGFTKTKDGIKPQIQDIYVKTNDNKSYSILIGAGNPYNKSSYYVMFRGDNNVYLVDEGVATAFQKTLNELEQEDTTAANAAQ